MRSVLACLRIEGKRGSLIRLAMFDGTRVARIRECKDTVKARGAEPSCRTHVSHGDSFPGPCGRKFLDFIRNSMGWDEKPRFLSYADTSVVQ